MQLINRRNTAIGLIILGLLALIAGVWILVSLFIPSKPSATSNTNLPGVGKNLPVATKSAPKVIALAPKGHGTSTVPLTATISDKDQVLNLSSDIVSRMGSGNNQEGFMGYEDAKLQATSKLADFFSSERQKMISQYPVTGAVYGVIDRVVAAKIVSGNEGDSNFTVEVKVQRIENAGDISKPTKISYPVYNVKLVKQSNGSFLADEITAQ